ncbi:MAG: hypothetical protein AABY67_09160, partial [Nitrospirota bacterium]
TQVISMETQVNPIKGMAFDMSLDPHFSPAAVRYYQAEASLNRERLLVLATGQLCKLLRPEDLQVEEAPRNDKKAEPHQDRGHDHSSSSSVFFVRHVSPCRHPR